MPRRPASPSAPPSTSPCRRVRYSVAASLDGFIAGPKGEVDWIIMDPEIDFQEIFNQFDTLVMGRRTYEKMIELGGGGPASSMPSFVCSRRLKQADHPDVTIVAHPEELVAELRCQPGKDVWLFGGGSLFQSLAEKRLVDSVEVALIPVLLGEGIPLLPPPATRISLQLTSHKLYPRTGIVYLEYAVQYPPQSKRRRQ